MGYIFIAMPILSWLFLSPDLDTVKNFEIGWILFIFIRNLAIILIYYTCPNSVYFFSYFYRVIN